MESEAVRFYISLVEHFARLWCEVRLGYRVSLREQTAQCWPEDGCRRDEFGTALI